MVEPISALLFSIAGAILYGVIGFLKQKQKFEVKFIATTIVAALIGAAVLLATGQDVNSGNITAVLLGNAGLASVADQIVTLVQNRFLKK